MDKWKQDLKRHWRGNRMKVEEAVQEFAAKQNAYELVEYFTTEGMEDVRCLGVRLKPEDAYMDFFMALTQFLDENEVEDRMSAGRGIGGINRKWDSGFFQAITVKKVCIKTK